jgi:hypothetical protein
VPPALGNFARWPNDRKNYHCQERSHDRPRDPDDRLLIPNCDIAPREDCEEIAISPKVVPIAFIGKPGLEDELVLGRSKSAFQASPIHIAQLNKFH